MFWLWPTADQHSEDGFMPGLSAAAIQLKVWGKGNVAPRTNVILLLPL
jgi:hypothetical protein